MSGFWVGLGIGFGLGLLYKTNGCQNKAGIYDKDHSDDAFIQHLFSLEKSRENLMIEYRETGDFEVFTNKADELIQKILQQYPAKVQSNAEKKSRGYRLVVGNQDAYAEEIFSVIFYLLEGYKYAWLEEEDLKLQEHPHEE